MAEALWARIAPHLTPDRTFDANGVGDWDGTPVWRPVGVNPLMRFVRYERAGLLIPHYDSPFVEDENHRTLMSLVIYLSDVAREQGGATRFLRDPQSRLPFAERDFSDQPEAVPVPVLEKSPRAGDALVFDHRVLHDGERVRMGRKLILRTDIMFERCPMAAA